MADIAASDLVYSGFEAGYDSACMGAQGFARQGTIAFGDASDTYPSGGIPLTPAKMGCPNRMRLKILESDAAVGLLVKYDESAQTLRLWRSGGLTPEGTNSTSAVTVTQATGAITDDDSAASNGTAVNVVPQSDGVNAFLESTTAGNADCVVLVGASGPAVGINDNDSPGGVQLYFDEDAANADERFLADLPLAQDVFIPTNDGHKIRVKHDASASSNGVAVYVDDDGASAHLRLLFVSPTDTAGSYQTDSDVSAQAAGTAAAQTFTGSAESAASLAEFSGAVPAMSLLVEAVGW